MAAAAGLGLPETRGGGGGEGGEGVRAPWRVLGGRGGPPVICVFVPETEAGEQGTGGSREGARVGAGPTRLRARLEGAGRAACVAGAVAAGTWAGPIAAAGLAASAFRAVLGRKHAPVHVPPARGQPPSREPGRLSSEASAGALSGASERQSGETSRVYARALPRTAFPAPALSGLPVAERTTTSEGATAWSGAPGGAAPSPLAQFPPGLTPEAGWAGGVSDSGESSLPGLLEPEGSPTSSDNAAATSLEADGTPGGGGFASKAFDAVVDLLQEDGLEQWEQWEEGELFKLPDSASDAQRFYAALSCLREMWKSQITALQKSLSTSSAELLLGERTIAEMGQVADEFAQAHEADKQAWLKEKAALEAEVAESHARLSSARKEARLVSAQAAEEREAFDGLLAAEQEAAQTYMEEQTQMYQDDLEELENSVLAMRTRQRAIQEENEDLRKARDDLAQRLDEEAREADLVSEALEAEVSTQALKNDTLEKEIAKIEADHRMQMQLHEIESARKLKAMENDVADYEKTLDAIRVDAAQFVTPKKQLNYDGSARRPGLRTALRAKGFIDEARGVRERYLQPVSPRGLSQVPMDVPRVASPLDSAVQTSAPGAAPAKTPASDRPLTAKSPPMMDVTNSRG